GRCRTRSWPTPTRRPSGSRCGSWRPRPGRGRCCWENSVRPRGDGPMGERVTVYVPLLDEGTAVWRQAQAEPVAPELFRLVGVVPDGELWAFQPGQVVRCREHIFSSGERRLTAI